MEKSVNQEIDHLVELLIAISNQAKVIGQESDQEGSKFTDLLSKFVTDFKASRACNDHRLPSLRIIAKEMLKMEKKVYAVQTEISAHLVELRTDIYQFYDILTDLQIILEK